MVKSRFLLLSTCIFFCLAVGVFCLQANHHAMESYFRIVVVGGLVFVAAAIAILYASDSTWEQVDEAINKAPPACRTIGWFFLISSALITLVCLGAMTMQASLLYNPGRHVHSDPSDFGMQFDLVRVTASDGVTIEAFYIHPKAGSKAECIMFCQGNGGNAADRLHMYKALHEGTGLALLIPMYRGYGNSEGRPFGAGIRKDMQAIIEWHSANHPNQRLIGAGDSMGGGIVIDTVHNYPEKFTKLIVINSFTSLHNLVPEIIPLPKSWISVMLHDKWASTEKIDDTLKGIDMLFMVGEQDRLINPKHCKALYEKAVYVGCKAKFVSQPDAGHADYRLEPIIDFINS